MLNITLITSSDVCQSIIPTAIYMPTAYSLQTAFTYFQLQAVNIHFVSEKERRQRLFFFHSTNLRSEVTYTVCLVIEFDVKEKSPNALLIRNSHFPFLCRGVADRVKIPIFYDAWKRKLT